MRIKQLLVVSAIAWGLAVPVGAAEHGHDHGQGAEKARLTLDHGKQWATDAPLRQGMAEIRQQMAAALPAIHRGKLTAAQYATLGGKVNAEVAAMVANCKLGTEADAQLHIVIADLMDGADTMAGKTKQTRRMDGALKVLGALDAYAAHFDHPGWQPIRH